ncbi:MAG: ABC transporter ATP-binding protein [Magnetococcales bacterium]|nr:ABC transporter ATP-binding protein [Magnetococcales bacterium]
MTPLLEVRQLTRQFQSPNQTLTILKGIDLTLGRGEMAALLGVSGAGKSTLIQILGMLDHPTSGQVLLNGTDLFALSRQQQAKVRNSRIGFIYQSHRLLPEFSALENVMMPLLIGRVASSQARDKAAQAIAAVGLTARADHRPGQLSGGEQQRIAIARAVVTNPELLLADEPTGNLDWQTAEQVFALLRQLSQQQDLACVMVTHNSELAARLDRRFHLVDGHIREQP